MSANVSFSTLENEFRRELRDKLDKSQDAFDLERRFQQVVARFLGKVFEGRLDIGDKAIAFSPGQAPHYALNPALADDPTFRETFDGSDLPSILARFAGQAHKDHLRLTRKDRQADQKIRNLQRG